MSIDQLGAGGIVPFDPTASPDSYTIAGVSPSGAAAWPLLDEIARRNMDAEIQAAGYAPTTAIDYTSTTAPSYVPVSLFGSDQVPTQALNGKPAVPSSGITDVFANTLGAQWPFIVGGLVVVLILVMRR